LNIYNLKLVRGGPWFRPQRIIQQEAVGVFKFDSSSAGLKPGKLRDEEDVFLGVPE